MTASKSVPPLDFLPTSWALIRRAAERFGDRDFLICDGAHYSYAQIERASRLLAKRLVLMGVGKGCRVAAKLPNGPEWVIAWLAVTRIGGFFLPLNSAYKPAEVKRCLRIGDVQYLISPTHIIGRDQRPVLEGILGRPADNGGAPLMIPDLPYLRHVIIIGEAGIDMLAPDEAVDARVPDGFLSELESEVVPADWMLAIFTSGTTSDPKCVVHSHGGPIRHASMIVDVQDWKTDDRIFAGMPFFWVGGNCYTLMPAMLIGAAVVCMAKFDADAALDLMERVQATRFTGWPGVLNPLLAHPTLADRDIPIFDNPVYSPKLGATTGLGMSETASNHTLFYARDRKRPEAIGSVGSPDPYLDHRIVDRDTGEEVPPGETGSIQVRGYSVMTGLYKREREEVFTRDGFYDTKDQGSIRDGFVFFAGRDIGLIKTSGNNVAAQEVELALKALPEVGDAYVVGVPDAATGHLVAAAIVPAAGATVDKALVQRRLAEHLSNYKVPQIIRVCSAAQIPFLSTGKLDHRRLVEWMGERVDG